MGQRSIFFITALAILAALLSTCTPANSKPGDFAIYLVKGGSVAPGADVNQPALEPTPFLSQDDLISYTWQTHALELTESARQRLALLEVPVTTGVPFVVCVGSERIYPGAFWVSYSSMSYDGVIIDTLPAMAGSPLIHIELGYPASPEFFTGPDPRPDPRIQQALQAAGLLK
jgi:hypothetical protein